MTDFHSSALPRVDDDAMQAAQFDARLYNQLRDIIHAAAADTPQMPVFLERLNSHGAQLLAHMSKSGRVTGVNYVYLGQQIKASTLGTEYTWSGLQRKLGVQYIQQRDNPLLAVEAMTGDGATGADVGDYAALQSSLPLDDEASPVRSTASVLAREAASNHEVASAPTAAAPDTRAVDSDASASRSASVAERAIEAPLVEDDLTESPDDGVEPVYNEFAADEAFAESEEWVASPPQSEFATRSSDTDAAALMDALQRAVSALEREQASRASGSDSAALVHLVDQTRLMVLDARQEVARARQESWRLAVTSAAVAGLVAALVVGLWMGQRADRAVARAMSGVVDHIDQQIAQDPVRAYFDKLVKKQSSSTK